MSEQALISVEHLSRYYGPLCALDDISFCVGKGEVLGLLGPNGAGKSSAMQILSGNLAPSAGRVWIGGIDILDDPKTAKGQLGYLPEQPPLYRELTVDEYLAYCARLHRIPRDRRRAAKASAKERCGLAEVGHRLIGNLSQGYQQRVGIAQAIIHGPAVVILDEPTVGLDPIQIREIRSLIRELGGEHSVILSSHILPEVQAVCDQVQIINRGRLVYSAAVEELRQRARAQSLILGLRRPPALDNLEQIPGVAAVEALEAGQFRIRYADGADPAEALAAEAVESGWGLFELSPEQVSLEQVFVDITSGKAASGAEEAAA